MVPVLCSGYNVIIVQLGFQTFPLCGKRAVDHLHALNRERESNVSNKAKENNATGWAIKSDNQQKVKFEIYGEELIEKMVKASGNSGRVYLPPDWIGHNVKIIRID
jgi:putative transposon-encoded protein